MTKEIKQIRTVCNAGKERSSMLAAALRNYLPECDIQARGSYGLEGQINGVATKYGWIPSEGFVQLLKKEQIDLTGHVSQMISREEIENSDLIFAVDSVVRERLLKAAPSAQDRIVLPMEYLRNKGQVAEFPFPDYCSPDIPDAYCGYMAPEAREIVLSQEQRVPENSQYSIEDIEFLTSQSSKKIHPLAVRSIPTGLRTYLGHKLQTDEAYLEEARFMNKLANQLAQEIKRGEKYGKS